MEKYKNSKNNENNSSNSQVFGRWPLTKIKHPHNHCHEIFCSQGMCSTERPATNSNSRFRFSQHRRQLRLRQQRRRDRLQERLERLQHRLPLRHRALQHLLRRCRTKRGTEVGRRCWFNNSGSPDKKPLLGQNFSCTVKMFEILSFN